MTDWSSGYVSSIDYTQGYYGEISLPWLEFSMLSSRHAIKEVRTACELGFGQGLSMIINSVATDTEWYGTDFNPNQASNAVALAEAANAKCHVFDQSFEEFCSRPDLPNFDFIALHGIWSWISDENRGCIVDFIRRKLKLGGTLYISYNAFPGWSSFVPLRHIMTEHVEIMNAPGNRLESRIDAALAFASDLLELSPAFQAIAPGLKERVAQMQGQNRSYVAHEYFNRDWRPMHFGEIAENLGNAKLSFVCSADLISEFDVINFSKAQLEFLEKIDDHHFRETVKDFFRGAQFRKDYWAKGHLSLTPNDFKQKMRDQTVMLISSPDKIKYKLRTRLGDVQLDKSIYEPIIDLIGTRDQVPYSEIEDSLVASGAAPLQVAQAVFVLVAKGDLQLRQQEERISRALAGCQRLNLHLVNQATARNSSNFLASPVLGRGVFVPRIHQLFIQSILAGDDRVESLAAHADRLIRESGAKIFAASSGTPAQLNTMEELIGQATEFVSSLLPTYRKLGIVPA